MYYEFDKKKGLFDFFDDGDWICCMDYDEVKELIKLLKKDLKIAEQNK